MEERRCNMCGRKLDLIDLRCGFSLYERMGYGTKYDGDMLDLHLCCECIESLIEECVLSPISTE